MQIPVTHVVTLDTEKHRWSDRLAKGLLLLDTVWLRLDGVSTNAAGESSIIVARSVRTEHHLLGLVCL